ncbi:PfaD family polyunsaturated fatty acid/polyketide biosynthesis protein [Streptomyces huasconensis]|uniref:PfaD family polyunsaturated fatty acid/polyketide biosynthesis protein n=1 Tax=Streptomyces huasconensis TaxID=1854574 RepID=UPI003F4CD145
MNLLPARPPAQPVTDPPARLRGQDPYATLADLENPVYVIGDGGTVQLSARPPAGGQALLAAAAPLPPGRLGPAAFRAHHGVQANYMAGAMAGGIAGTELVRALARAGYLASLGAAGLSAARLDAALGTLARDLPDTPYACNLIHTPSAPRLEGLCVDLCLRHRVRCVEASAFVQLTPDLVRYRATGLRRGRDGSVTVGHRVVAKVSLPQTAEMFLRPAPEALVAELLRRGALTVEQAELARTVPMADDVTVEADSGGHTDRRALSVVLPAVLALRDRIGEERSRTSMPVVPAVRVGAAGGIGTPHAVAAAFALGAEYVVTGSVNQATVEAATGDAVKRLLATADLTDCLMAPAADMFEQGVTVQVLGRRTLFAGRAALLHRLYRDHDSLDDISAEQRRHLEQRVLGLPVEEVWRQTRAYLGTHDAGRLARADADPKHRMALVFRWYLANASRWATAGDQRRSSDWQIWCGPAMGAFNQWTRDTALAEPDGRHAADIARHLMRGAAYLTRLHHLRSSGVHLPPSCDQYRLPPARRVPPPADAEPRRTPYQSVHS